MIGLKNLCHLLNQSDAKPLKPIMVLVLVLVLRPSNENTQMNLLQPRRIVAMSIAERVASERGEMLGKSVGYQVFH